MTTQLWRIAHDARRRRKRRGDARLGRRVRRKRRCLRGRGRRWRLWLVALSSVELEPVRVSVRRPARRPGPRDDGMPAHRASTVADRAALPRLSRGAFDASVHRSNLMDPHALLTVKRNSSSTGSKHAHTDKTPIRVPPKGPRPRRRRYRVRRRAARAWRHRGKRRHHAGLGRRLRLGWRCVRGRRRGRWRVLVAEPAASGHRLGRRQ
jgi:hypothetical protein